MADAVEDRHLKLTGEFDCDATPLATLRHSTSHVMAQAVKRLWPDVKVDDRPRHRGRLLLRLREGGAVRAGGPRQDRRRDARDHQGEHAVRAAGDVARGRDRVLPRARRVLQGRDHRGHRRAHGVALPAGRLHRPVPRPARAVDGRHQGLQAPLVVRRVLARRREEPDAVAHLRHGVAHEGRSRPVPLAARGSEEARPPQARARARPLHLQRGLAGRALLAAERLDDRARAREVRARGARRRAATRRSPRRSS